MTKDLTPQVVTTALEGATPGPWHTVKRLDEDEASLVCFEDAHFEGIVAECSSYHTGQPIGKDAANARLIAMAPDLAREYLRLKKVEDAGKRLEMAAKEWRDLSNPWRADDVANDLRSALAAFRAAMEGE